MSWNWLKHHDKTDLIGSSDTRFQDRGQHRVTQHHNRWTDIGQRAPRVRFGDVHVYNNLYEQTEASLAETVPGSPFFQYFWGAGVESSIVAEQNAIELLPSSPVDHIIAGWKGTELSETGTLVNGEIVDVLGAFNATSPAKLSPVVRWNPADKYEYQAQPVDRSGGRGARRRRSRHPELRHAHRHRARRAPSACRTTTAGTPACATATTASRRISGGVRTRAS